MEKQQKIEKKGKIQQELQKQYYVGIRREDKNKWERRASITPREVKIVISQNPNIHFVVQPSKLRIFTDKEYIKAGAEINEDLDKCETIFAVKEVPIQKMIKNKTYLYFAHVIKAQEANMPSLDAMLEKNLRFIDYERIRDKNDVRLVAFGKFAGIAGTIDLLSYVGKFLLTKGYSTPFLNISMTYLFMNVQIAMQSLKMIGNMLESQGLPQEIIPFVFGVTGYGRCAQGTLQVIKNFNHKMVDPDDLYKLFEDLENPEHQTTIYVVVFKQNHMVEKIETKENEKFDKQHYYLKPHLYKSIFEQKYLQYVSVISHNMYWDYQFPKLIRLKQVKILASEQKLRLLAIADITCDVDGSIELFKKVTTLDKPYYMIDPISNQMSDDMEKMKDGIMYLGIDHWPSETARDSSEHFGKNLLPFIKDIVMSEKNTTLQKSGLPLEIQRGVVCNHGKLEKDFRYIIPLRKNNELAKKSKFQTTMKKGLLKSVGSFTQVKIMGHLFDSQGINEMVNIFVDNQIEFNFLKWNVGKSNEQSSEVTIQIYSKKQGEFIQVMNNLQDICQKKNLEIIFQHQW